MLSNGNGGGISVAQNANYTLDTTGSLQGSNSAYDKNCDVTCDKITWNITGNTQQNPWRIGGKSLTDTNREVYTKTAYSSEVSSIKLTVGTASSITVNSLKLLVSKNAAFTDTTQISAVFEASSTIEFKPEVGNFPENSYYKFVFNVSVSDKKKNKFIEFNKVEFFNASSDKAPTTTTFGGDVDNQTFVVNIGSTFEGKKATLTPAEAGEIKYSSDKPEVASVNNANGDIKLGTVEGTATITASFDGNDTYEASSAKYYINVKDHNTPVFYESFDKTNGTGGNDGSWNGGIATNDLKYDNPGWTSEYAKGANKCAKLGSDKKGTATTPAINLSNGTYTLTFRAGAWNSSKEGTTIKVTISDGYLKYGETTAKTQTITMEKAAWTDYSMTISDASSATTIKFSAINASDNRFFLDEVKIVQSQPQPTLTFSETEKTVYFKEEEDFKAPTLILKDADKNIVEGATYNYASSNPEAISVDNSGKITFETKNKPANVTITATYSGQVEEYKDLSASYEIKYGRNPASAYSNIKELKDYAIKDESVTLSLDDAQVVYANGTNVFVRDASGAICFCDLEISELVKNAVLNGTIKGKFRVSYGMPQLIKDGTNTNADNLTITAGEAAQPKDLTHGSFADYTCDLVKVNKGIVDNNGTDVKLMNQDVESAVFYDKFKINYSNPFNSAEVDVTGIVIPYVANGSTETIIEIAPTNKYDIVYRFSENDITTHVGAVSDAKVAIVRTLLSDYWNTLCLPFSLSAEQITTTFGEGTIITEFDDVNAEGTVMKFKEATSIEAGKPYLFKPANTVVNPVFEGVAITSEGAKMVKAPTNEDYAFVGTYSKKDMATDKSQVFITTSGKLSYPAEDTNTIKGMRAFIQLPKTANAKAFNLNIGGEATSIDTIDGGLFNGNATIYNLNGQKMSSDINGLAKGLYIVNGKKMIVK